MTATKISLKRIFVMFLMSFMALVITPSAALADEPLVIDYDAPFHPSDNLTADIDKTLAQAWAERKLALIIMGANWCHDTAALLEHFADPELATTLEENYQTLLVDVGYLEYGEDVITRFGMPVFYGTPTVLIIDPATEQLLNKDSMFQWFDAYNIELDVAQDYFASLASATPDETENVSPQLAVLYSEIDAFENAQAKRLYRAFEILSPMLELHEEDKEPAEFMDYWYEVRDVRYTITDYLADLRAEARERVAAGEKNITLEYPDYPAFSWE